MDNRKFNDQEEVRRNYLKELQASNNDPFINERFIRNYAEIKITQTGVKFWFYVVFTIKPNKVQLIDYVFKTNFWCY